MENADTRAGGEQGGAPLPRLVVQRLPLLNRVDRRFRGRIFPEDDVRLKELEYSSPSEGNSQRTHDQETNADSEENPLPLGVGALIMHENEHECRTHKQRDALDELAGGQHKMAVLSKLTFN